MRPITIYRERVWDHSPATASPNEWPTIPMEGGLWAIQCREKSGGGVEFAVWRMIARQPVQAMGLKTKRPMICQTAFGPEPNGSHREQ